MAFALFAWNAFEIFHFGCNNWWADEANVVQLGHLATSLIILDENLNILNILEFHVAQIDLLASEIFWFQTERKFKKD